MKYATILFAVACLTLQGCQTPEQIAANQARRQQAAVVATSSDCNLRPRDMSASTALAQSMDPNMRMIGQTALAQENTRQQSIAARCGDKQGYYQLKQLEMQQQQIEMQRQQQQQQEIDRLNAIRPTTTNCHSNGVGGLVCTTQ